ncbi:MAG: hypothetical protein ABI163_17545 [Thermoanaerobaculia bacterium]
MNKVVIVSYFAAVLACGVRSPVRASIAASVVRLDCPKHLKIDKGQRLTIRCRVENAGDDEFYMLADDLSLEGPKRGEPYFFAPIGWERFENVLQYNSLSAGLDVPTLFHRTVHLGFEQMSRLVALPARSNLDANILWQLPSGSDFPSPGKWAVKIKLIYLTHDRASDLLKNKKLSSSCRGDFSNVLSRSARAKTLTLTTRRSEGKLKWYYDGCRDIISRSFTHLYSESLVVEISKP